MSVEIFIKRPVLSTVISIMTVILGLIGLVSLPIEQYPDIAPPTIFVRAQYPGASAETVQKSVLAPLEEAINGVEGMTYMTSSASNQGSASITVYFEQGYNGDMAQVNVQNHVSQALALLPSEVTQGGVSVQKRQTSTLLIVGVTSTEGQYDEKFLNNYADINIIPAIKRVKGVGDCDAMGLKSYTMRLWLDPAKMKEQNLIPSDIAGVLAEQNIEGAPGSFGELSENQYEYSMRYTGRLTTPEEFGDMIIRADADGNVLRVKDVARVEMGQLYYTINTILNNKPAFMMMISQMVGSNATDVVKRTKATLADLEKNFPPGLKIEYMQDVTLFLNASIHEVVKTLFEAFFLVFLVVLIFLQDWRSTLIPLIAVPVSLIGTFFVLNLIGFSLNLLTLSALVLAIAIVVDDAIVVVEAVHAKLDMGYKSARQASIDAMNEISGAIVSITLVMASVFIPVSFIGGTAGTFYQQFGITLAISIVLSAVNALTLSPALCSIFLKPKDEHGNEMKMGVLDKFYSNFNASYNAMLEKYKKVVRFFIDRKGLTVIVLIIGIAALGITSQFTKTGLIPNEDTGTLFVTIATPPGTSLTETKKVAMQVDEMIGNNPAVDARLCIAGYSFIGGMGTNMATFIIRLKDFDDRSVTESSNMVLGMIYKQTGAIKGSQILAFQPPMVTGFSLTNGITFTMQDRTGGDIMKFFETTQKFLAELNKRPEISNAMTMFNPTYPQYLVEVNNAKCKQNGISPKTVISTMQGYFGGMYSSNFNSYGKLYRVYIQSDFEYRDAPDDIDNIYTRTSSGSMAPIGEYMNLKKVYGPQVLNRFNLFNSIDINAAPGDGVSTGEALAAIEEVAKDVLPAGITYEYSGLTRSESQSSNTTMLIFALCLLFVYLILSAQYESYILPLAVILSIPFGLAGAFIFTNMFGKANDIYMQLALIMLIGLLAKNAILIVEFALERRRLGMAISWAGLLGAAARLRPILMTSLAMIIGLMPLLSFSTLSLAVEMAAVVKYAVIAFLILLIAVGIFLYMRNSKLTGATIIIVALVLGKVLLLTGSLSVGENGNCTIGAAAIGGMLIGMVLQVIIVPALFVIFQYLQEKVKPMEYDLDQNTDISSELKQYTNPIV